MAPPVYIIDGARTPFLKAKGKPGPFTPVDLAVQAGRSLLARQTFEKTEISEVILGCVNVHPDEVNPARVACLRLGIGSHVPAWTVQRNCASGLQAIYSGRQSILEDTADLVLVGGTEALSHSPLLFNHEATLWFSDLAQQKGLLQKLRHFLRLRPSFFYPSLGILRGLKDPFVELSMGQTAEILAYQYGISREMADAYAEESHKRLYKASQEGWLCEKQGIISPEGETFEEDDGVRPQTTAHDLARLRPVFEKPFGQVTAGNASQVSDGAAWLILASEKAVKKYGLTPLGKIVACTWAAVPPQVMGLGPVFAIENLLDTARVAFEDIGIWEINEAFAAQVLACQKAMADPKFCEHFLGRPEKLGEIDFSNLNIDGGAISVGHPVSASGARITLHLLHLLARKEQKYGVAAACIGGGMGGAILCERGESL